MTTHSQTGSFDLSALNNLNQNLTQYFWFEEGGSGSYPWGLGAHVTLYPQSEFTDPNDSNYLKGQNILINTDGFSLRNGTIPLMAIDNDSLDFNLITDLSQGTYVNVATFGTTAIQIGQTGQTRTVVDYHSMQMVDKGGNEYFHISDLRDASGYATFTMTVVSSATTAIFELPLIPTSIVSVTVNGVETSDYVWSGMNVEVRHVPVGSTIVVTYQTNSVSAKAFTFGSRESSSPTIGGLSFGEGAGVKASGFCSHAEGYRSEASGYYSHAEGEDTTASGNSSHAEGSSSKASGPYSHAEGSKSEASGYYSHAEGSNTTASDQGSHAEGVRTTASDYCSHAEGFLTNADGYCSHAQNYGTKASSNSQTAIGKYNVEDTHDTYALIIGNGTDDDARRNLLTIGWKGKVNINADGYASNQAQLLVSINGTSRLYFGVGSAGVNHGIYSYDRGNWLIYSDASQTYIPSGLSVTGDMNVSSGHKYNVNGTPIINNITQITGSYKATSASTWLYNGGSITVPSGHAYIVRLQLGWTSGKPIGVGLHGSTTLGTAGYPNFHYQDAEGLYNAPAFVLYSGTYYMFEKRATVPSSNNSYWINAIDILI